MRVPRLFGSSSTTFTAGLHPHHHGNASTTFSRTRRRASSRPRTRGKRLKIYYMTQVGVCPPHFVIFCNDRQLFHFSYQRYIENCIRNVFGLEGTPIILHSSEGG